MLRQISEMTGGAYYAADDPDELAAIYDEHRHPPRRPARGDGGHLAVRGRRRPVLLVGGVASLAGSGGCHERRASRPAGPPGPPDGLPVAGPRSCSSLCCPCSSAVRVWLAAPAPLRACATPACRSSARRSRGRRASAATCRSRCSCSASAASSSRWPGRSASSASRPARRRSSSRWTSRGSMCATDIPPNRLHGRRGRRGVVHRAPGFDAPRSGSSRSPGSPRSSRRRRPTRRSCSTSSRA